MSAIDHKSSTPKPSIRKGKFIWGVAFSGDLGGVKLMRGGRKNPTTFSPRGACICVGRYGLRERGESIERYAVIRVRRLGM
mgnify:CR=1 FL=1